MIHIQIRLISEVHTQEGNHLKFAKDDLKQNTFLCLALNLYSRTGAYEGKINRGLTKAPEKKVY